MAEDSELPAAIFDFTPTTHDSPQPSNSNSITTDQDSQPSSSVPSSTGAIKKFKHERDDEKEMAKEKPPRVAKPPPKPTTVRLDFENYRPSNHPKFLGLEHIKTQLWLIIECVICYGLVEANLPPMTCPNFHTSKFHSY